MAETTAPPPLTLAAVRGLEKTSDAFKRELIAVALRLGLDPNHLASVMSFESAGTFSPSERNPYSGAVGLIQFTDRPTGKGVATTLGTTLGALSVMTPIAQLAYVEKFFRGVLAGRRLTGPNALRDTYLCVIAPFYVLSPPGTVIYSQAESPDQYKGNKGLDANDDKKITAEEAAAPVEAILRVALTRPPLVVPPAPQGNSETTSIAFLVGLLGIVLALFNARRAKVNGHV